VIASVESPVKLVFEKEFELGAHSLVVMLFEENGQMAVQMGSDSLTRSSCTGAFAEPRGRLERAAGCAVQRGQNGAVLRKRIRKGVLWRQLPPGTVPTASFRSERAVLQLHRPLATE